MIERIEIRQVGEEKILAVFLDFSLEIGSNINNKDNKEILDYIKEYLFKLNKKEIYKKALIVVGGVVVATLLNVGGNFHVTSNKDASQLFNSSIPIEEVVEMNTSYFFLDDIPLAESNDDKNAIDLEVLEKEETKAMNSEKKQEQNLNKEQANNKNNKDDGSKSDKKETNKDNNLASNNEEIKQAVPSDSKETQEQTFKQMVTVYRSNGTVLEIELEEYIVGVVAAEMPASFSGEALKAQAVVARTYALKKMANNQKLTDSVLTQAYIDINQMKTKWGSEFSKYYNKIKNAVTATTGEYITYQGNYINAVYHSTSNGYTEDATNVWNESYPYLKSVESSWDKKVNSYERVITKDYQNLLDITGLQTDDAVDIKILSRNASGRVEQVSVGDKIYTGVEFRNLLGLRSTDFDIEDKDGKVQITTRGYGHGVGMSQYGANEMSKLGYNYKQIINHYYSGVQIKK